MTLTLSIRGLDSALSVRRFDVRERLSNLFTVSIVACSSLPDLDLDPIVFQAASFTMVGGWAYVREGGKRHITGLCSSITQLQAEPSGLSRYSLRIVPCLWLLTQRRDCRIFQNVTIPDVITQVLEPFAIVHAWRIDRDAFPRLSYKVQYNESDFAFLCRLCEEAGITFSFEDDEARGSVLVLTDAPCAAPPREGPPLPYVDNPNASAETESITRVRLSREGRAGAVTLRDYDFRNPSLPLHEKASRSDSLDSRLEHYRYAPGAFRILNDGPTPTPIADKNGAARHDPQYGHAHAERMLAGEHAGALTLSFRSNALDLAPGAVFAMAGHPHPRLADSRTYLVTQLRSRGRHDGEWTTSGKAVLTDRPYRPPLLTPKPVVYGLQSARVTGPPGRDIFTDELARVRVQFPWDRRGKSDDTSSCWIRVSQGWAGAGFGLWTLPRVGHEVLVGFLEGNPDEPIVVGRAPNAHNPPPYSLPANETKSVWRSQSTPGADGFNEISFEDRKGEERFYEKAQKDKETCVQNDERLTVGGDRQKLVRCDEDSIILGDQKKLVGEDLHLTIKGDQRVHVEGSGSETIDGDRDDRVCGRCGLSSGGQLHLSSDTHIVLSAPSITIQGAGGFITFNGGGVALHGVNVTIQQGGAPGIGAPIRPAAPLTPVMAATLFPPAPGSVVHLPMFGFTPTIPLNIGPDVETLVICQAICKCSSALKPNGRKGAQDCVTSRLRAHDANLGGQSTIKPEVSYDMSKTPPEPIMSKNHPVPTTGHPKGSRRPDITLVKDGTKPVTRDNMKKIIEVKFPPDQLTHAQNNDYPQIAGDNPFEVWGPNDPCFCNDQTKAPVPVSGKVSNEEILAIFMMALGLAVLIVDDALPGGMVDDMLIPPAIAKLAAQLAPLLVILGPVIPPPAPAPSPAPRIRE